MSFTQKLQKKFSENKHIAVGLDSDINKIPQHLKNNSDPIFEFNRIIIENTASYAASYKLNFAFYEGDGARGFEALQKTIEIIPEDVLIIGDAKRGDIGNTSEMYAKSVFDHFKCDSVTLAPYMGIDSIEPFIKYEDKLSFILALTSNKSSADFEKLRLEGGEYLYQRVIRKVKEWNTRKNCGVVFGATNLAELSENLELLKGLYLLIPGVGAQGGSAKDVSSVLSKAGISEYLINVSRSLIYADSGKDFGAAAKKEIVKLNEEISH
ncbi:MAG TPA: orotidine-5'-phosphate decarboxylase [Ignavibacteriales bacterium]|nr:orotidine-5'-phosphate decarboxylase [Ignavibacteriales bacterium]